MFNERSGYETCARKYCWGPCDKNSLNLGLTAWIVYKKKGFLTIFKFEYFRSKLSLKFILIKFYNNIFCYYKYNIVLNFLHYDVLINYVTYDLGIF